MKKTITIFSLLCGSSKFFIIDLILNGVDKFSHTFVNLHLFKTEVQGWTYVFSRDLALCGNKDDSNGDGDGGGVPQPRDCSNYLGSGQCKSSQGTTYDWCQNTVVDANECLVVAEQSDFAVGWEYFGESRTCYILFDNTLSENEVLRFCPSGFKTNDSRYIGTGFPVDVISDNRYLCYSCDDSN